MFIFSIVCNTKVANNVNKNEREEESSQDSAYRMRKHEEEVIRLTKATWHRMFAVLDLAFNMQNN